ncbi:hypothetical protein POX_b02346 [Penicillium oxalicum]|uniref:Uncharacterized protein n=1 Tax=Penicillium oxalicum (strain 114-2 / CGMCC 5302) TaxID=933388 RepID=S8AWI5_PENO1|nr:hypothetical protein POX_b02346 [Penicillium oxalicum]EPS30648.1 hypothetical protein PDE_05600 [Penicillium oxalicum 114-2]KAI2792309.1 hypothetical protein POX_b02346 [Penicillium oxalicum]
MDDQHLVSRRSSTGDWQEKEERVFYGISIAASLIQLFVFMGLIVAIWHRKGQSVEKGLILRKYLLSSSIAYLLSGILSVIVGSMAAAPSPYSEIYIFPAMVQWFFYLLALCMTFYILFRLAQLFQQRSMGGSSRKLGRMHMFSLAVVVLASLLEWIFYVVYICQGQRIFSHRIFYDTYHWSGCVRQLVHWLASLQVLIQAIFATVRSYKMDRQVSRSATLFLISSTAFFAINVFWSVIFIDWSIVHWLRNELPHNVYPIKLFAAVFEPVCTVIAYVCLLKCCSQLVLYKAFNSHHSDTGLVFGHLGSRDDQPYLSVLHHAPHTTQL